MAELRSWTQSLVCLVAVAVPAAAWGASLTYHNDFAGRHRFATAPVGPTTSLVPIFGGAGRLPGELAAAGGSGGVGFPILGAPSVIADVPGADPGFPTRLTTVQGSLGDLRFGRSHSMVVDSSSAWGVDVPTSIISARPVGTMAAIATSGGSASFTSPAAADFNGVARLSFLVTTPFGGVFESGVQTTVTVGGTTYTAQVTAAGDGPSSRPEFVLLNNSGLPAPQFTGTITQLGPTVYGVDALVHWQFATVAADVVSINSTLTHAAAPGTTIRAIDWTHALAAPTDAVGSGVARHAAIWTNGAGGASWGTAGNWDLGAAPSGALADVVFGNQGIAAGGSVVQLGGSPAVRSLLFAHSSGAYTLDSVVDVNTVTLGDATTPGSVETWSGAAEIINARLAAPLSLSLLAADTTSSLTLAGRVSTGALSFDGPGTVTLQNGSSSFTSLDVNAGLARFGDFSVKLSAPVSIAAASVLEHQGQAWLSGPVTIDAGGQLSLLSTAPAGNHFEGTVVNNGQIYKGPDAKVVITGPYSGSGLLLHGDTGISSVASLATLLARSTQFANGTVNNLAGVGLVNPSSSDPVVAVDGSGTTVHLTGTWQGDGATSNNFVVVTGGGHFVVDAGATIDTRVNPGFPTNFLLRGDGTGTVEFSPGFDADVIAGDQVDLGLMRIGGVTWTTHNVESLPAIFSFDGDNAAWRIRTAPHEFGGEIRVLRSATFDVGAGADLILQGFFALGDAANPNRTLTKTGAGTLVINALQVHGNGVVMNAAGGLMQLNTDGGETLSLIVDAAASLGSVQHLAAATVHAGGRLSLAPGADKTLSVATLAVDPAGRLDIADNDLVIRATAATRAAVLADATARIATGAAGLAWNGPGINSSAAAGDSQLLTAVGVMLNDDGQGGPFHATFAGETVDQNAVLVKYTYYGDADLSGSVDGTDYALIDNGFNASLHGWFNGDFDYSGIVDGTDYALIDNAFNSQGGPLVWHAAPAAVPEPGTWLLLATGGLAASIGRRRAAGRLRRPARRDIHGA